MCTNRVSNQIVAEEEEVMQRTRRSRESIKTKREREKKRNRPERVNESSMTGVKFDNTIK